MGDQAARPVRPSEAQTLGWPDNYTFTKAMGERAVEDRGGARRPAVDRAPLDHRVQLRAPVPRLDRGLQDGRADHPRLRTRHDPGFPWDTRGHHRHHPGRLRRERDAGRRRRTRPSRRRPPTTTSRRGLGTHCSTRVCTYEGTSSAIRSPAGARHRQGPRVDVPQTARRTPPSDRRTRRRRGRQGRHPPAQVQAHARPRRARRPRQGPRGLRAPLLGPVRGVHRGRGDLHRRPDGRAVGWVDDGRPEAFPFDAAVDWRYYLQDVHCPAVTSGLRACRASA